MTAHSSVSDLTSGFPVVVQIPVAWAEMDYFRHVNNTVFFRWFETARIAYLEAIGFAEEIGDQRLGPILASTHARFRRPVFFPDTIHAAARAAEVTDDRFVMEYRVVSEKRGEIAGEGGAVVVSYAYSERMKAPLPEQVRAAINELEGR
jgi:acyl-CoA thioester hydrolase